MGYESRALGRFELAAAWRLTVSFGCVALAAWLFGRGRFWVTAAVLVTVAVWQAIALARMVRRSHARIAAALAGWRSHELSDRGGGDLADTAFPALAAALDGVTRQLRGDRARAEEELRMLQAIVGHAPVALVILDGSRLEVVNHAARRMFGPAVASLADLAGFGGTLVRDVAETPAGERRVARIVIEGVARRLLITAGTLQVRGAVRRLIAVESIETELETRTLEAWVDMARVLAHEIMSSLTPVASLSATAAQQLGDLEVRVAATGSLDEPARELLGEARIATDTAARRSERLMTFVRRYRELAQLPAAQPAPVDAVELVTGVAALLGGELVAAGAALIVDAPASALALRGDRGLLEHALINLVRNAADAVRERAGGCVWLIVRVTIDDRIAIEVADNGPGVPAAMTDKIFVPFFTTKRGGSGIGLAVAQHVAHAHHGSLRLAERAGGGAVFSLVL